ncbi:putative surface protein bspA-like [Dissostichus eleginoides]|uniref:Surface protein bspA-like n=1 Tax=Dissostichus eleginoides TaxID=100907 RepID=A0AAD9CPA9_DISEL|nr:putative surface protein bspA-like [Dissostichus eleginoides]
MVTETLTCTKCRSTHVSWSQTVLSQLDLVHRSEFRVILTQKFACDIRVIRLLRERGLGNSPTMMLKQLRENHTEEWLHRVARYTTECVGFLQGPGLLPVTFPEPPEPAVVPSCKWLLSVYSQDILTRLEEIKARITSTYGSILKMDSTRKITKKLAGTAKGTALWLTSVGNENGQILISVLTAQEGAGLDMMAANLVRRYQQAGVGPPVLLYVDCGCCTESGETKLKARFSGWPDLTVRLDIWHFMRRLALGCTTDAHQLYPIFMSRLSTCIFEWDAADLALLREAKRQQLQSQGLSFLTDADVSNHLTKDELALHCRRRTRGEGTTTQLLEELLLGLIGNGGNDSLGVPLFDRERMEHILRVQRKHIKCIQDMPGVALYIKTGELTKGGVRLPTYRCARGSTSLESFHLHLNRFIPGTSANSVNFQIYLLEGLHRWNQDRGTAALGTGPSALRSYSGDLLHCVNKNFEKLFGRKMVPEFYPTSRYTGELIGMQYLLQQTGQALQDMHPDSEEIAQLIEEHEDIMEEDEGFSDIRDDPTVLDLGQNHPGPQQNHPAPQQNHPGPQQNHPAPQQNHPGPQKNHPGPQQNHPGPQQNHPGPQQNHPGPSRTILTSGTSTLAPSTATLAPSRTTPTSGISIRAPSKTTGALSRTTPTPSTSAQASAAEILPSSSSSEASVNKQAEEEEMAVDDQNIPGIQHVDRLAEYLVDLRDKTSLCLSNRQAGEIVALWDNLEEVDKQRVVYAARHQDRILSGHFRTPKKPSKTPGVESTTRCMLGASSAPAQWPDCCRLVESIFIRLCDLHRSPVRKGKGAISRWSIILRDYTKIRQLVVGNYLVIQGTQIKLVQVNQTTLITWHNSRQKNQELSVLLQGTALLPALPESDEPLQAARVLPAVPTPAQHEHQYRLLESTAGQARQRQKASSLPLPILLKGRAKRSLSITPPAPAPALQPQVSFVTPTGQTVCYVPVAFPAAIQGTTPPTVIPVATLGAGATPKRLYRRTVEANTCKKCGQFRTAETGHSQYRGRVFCP